MLCDFLFMAGSTLFGRNHRIDKYRLALVLLVRIGTGRSFLGLVAVVAIDLLLGMRTLGPFTDQARVVFLVAAHALLPIATSSAVLTTFTLLAGAAATQEETSRQRTGNSDFCKTLFAFMTDPPRSLI